MRLFSLIILSLFIILLQTTHLSLAGDTIPTSKRSKAAYKRIAPRLVKNMRGQGHHLGDSVFIRIFKQEKQLEIWLRNGLTYKLFKTYPICYNSGRLGPKLREGDKQSPEGFYAVGAKQLNPNSSYHLSFNLGYPNEYDRSWRRTGSLLMVHGRCSSAGCFAMTDFRMDEIYSIVESAIISGQHQVPVHIFPFKMTRFNMRMHKNSKWLPFWENLKEGFDYFEGHHAPPIVTVQNRRYQFITSRHLLFGGNFPPRTQEGKYVKFKRPDWRTKTL